jgi:hypothetical protein
MVSPCPPPIKNRVRHPQQSKRGCRELLTRPFRIFGEVDFGSCVSVDDSCRNIPMNIAVSWNLSDITGTLYTLSMY